MQTLKELIENKKCRTGKAYGTSKQGAFWLAVVPIQIRSYGGDGIGQSRADFRNYLQLRHYRDGKVKAVVNFHSWHQNCGDENTYVTAPILDCVSVEDVIVSLMTVNDREDHAYGEETGRENLIAALTGLGLVEALPAPDEVAA